MITSIKETDKDSQSDATDIAENNSIKKLRKRQVSAKPKFKKLTKDQEDFLNRTGRYAPYRPVRTEAQEEDFSN